MTDYLNRVINTQVNKAKSYVPFEYQLAARAFSNNSERLVDMAKGDYAKINPKYKAPESYEAPSGINFAKLSQAAYTPNAYVPNYKLIKEFSSPDRTVYQHSPSGHVVISFRGTDVKNYRDLTTDALLALGKTSILNRFSNADKVAQNVIKRYGKQNVSVTGHSLGGSQALHVSRKYGINAHVFNPHVSWDAAITNTYYKHAHIYRNITDPVPAFSRGAYFKTVTVKSNPNAGFGIPQHGLSFWVDEFNKKNKKTTGKYAVK